MTAAFSKVECDHCIQYNLFPLSKLTTILPFYFNFLIQFSAFSALAWIIAIEAKEFKFEMRLAAILVTGRLLDYILRGSEWWHLTIGDYIFSYDTFAFLVFAILVIVNHYYQLWNST